MCRSTTEYGSVQLYPRRRDRLRINSFYIRLYAGPSCARRRMSLTETVTLVYLPRIRGDPLEINGAKVRAETPAFVPLQRVPSVEAMYASTDRVVAGEAVSFEIYVGTKKAIKGVFQRSIEYNGERGVRWRMECRCATEVNPEPMGVVAAEVCVTEERGVAMWEKVEMRALRRGFCLRLQDIPEEGETEASDCCETWSDGEGRESIKLDDCDWMEMEEMNGDGLELDVVRWAVDVGIWVACLGFGLLVSKASSRRLRRLILL